MKDRLIYKIEQLREQYVKDREHPIYRCSACSNTGELGEAFYLGNWSKGTETACKKCGCERGETADIERINGLEPLEIFDKILDLVRNEW